MYTCILHAYLLPTPISYSIYTGTKNVAKMLATIVKGRRGNPVRQLADKSKGIFYVQGTYTCTCM